jgi:hypothetical protein
LLPTPTLLMKPAQSRSRKIVSPGERAHKVRDAVVCTENSVRIDYLTESPNVSGDDCSVLPLRGPVRLAVQVEEPT